MLNQHAKFAKAVNLIEEAIRQFLRLRGILILTAFAPISACTHQSESDIAKSWNARIAAAIRECPVAFRSGHARYNDFVRSNRVREVIVEEIGDSWKTMKAVETRSEEAMVYFAWILVDDSIVYAITCINHPPEITIRQLTATDEQFDIAMSEFEDFPDYNLKCESEYVTVFYYMIER